MDQKQVLQERREQIRNHSINSQLIAMVIVLIVVLLVNVGLGIAFQYNFVVKNVTQMLNENLDAASKIADNGVATLKILINDHAYDYEFIAGSAEQKEDHLKTITSFDENVISLSYIGADGNVYGGELSSGIVNTLMSGSGVITTPDGENGTFYIGMRTEFGSLVSHMKASKLTTIIAGSACDMLILDNAGNVIAADSKNGAYDATYSQYVNKAGGKIVDNKPRKYTDGKRYVYASEYIEGSDGWSILIRARSGEYYNPVVVAFFVNIVLLVLISGLFIFSALMIKKMTIKPVEAVLAKIRDMSQGHLYGEPLKPSYSRELTELSMAVNELSDINKDIISDLGRTAEAIANENLAVHTSAQYNGDFLPVKNSLEKIIDSIRGVVLNVEDAAGKLSQSSSQMSSNSAVLSQAAAEEASTVAELNENLNGVHELINNSAAKASKALEVAETSVAAMDQGNAKMESMLAAMNEINESSSEIANIIKAIQDISFQTNILALNASIEAARAGEAGKGFAVVAEEVSSLSDKTSDAAKSTTKLIQNSLKAVEHGTVIANESAEVLKDIAKQALESAEVVKDIAETANKQTDAINQVLDGMNRISTSVSQINNSASECEESSNVLSEESTLLRDTISGFVIDDSKPRTAPTAPKSSPSAPKPAPSAPKPAPSAPKSAPSAPVDPERTAPSPKPASTSKTRSITLPDDTPSPAPAAPAAKSITLPDDDAPSAPKPVSKPAAKPAAPKFPFGKSAADKPTTKPAAPKSAAPKSAAKTASASTAAKPAAPSKSITLPGDKASTPAKPAAAPKPVIKDDVEITQAAPTKAVSKATMQPVKRTIRLDNDKY